jgi:hypothetical protein
VKRTLFISRSCPILHAILVLMAVLGRLRRDRADAKNDVKKIIRGQLLSEKMRFEKT